MKQNHNSVVNFLAMPILYQIVRAISANCIAKPKQLCLERMYQHLQRDKEFPEVHSSFLLARTQKKVLAVMVSH